MRKHVFLVAAAVAALLSVTTAAVGASAHRTLASSAKGPSGSATVSVGTDPGSLDPQLTLLSAARYVDSFAYDTLVTLTGPGKIASGVAQSWKVVSPKRVEFTLRRNVTCADGSKMTATVVKKNLDFVGNPANKSPLLGLFVPVGAKVPRTTARAPLSSRRRRRSPSCSRASLWCSSSARRGSPTAACSRAAPTERARTPSRASWPATTTPSRCARATRGGRTARRPPSTGCPRR